MIDTQADFTGKVLWLEVAGAPAERGGVLLEYAEIRQIAGRVFLVGRMADWDVSGWLAGAETAVAWDSVVQYVVFKSRDDYQERAGTQKAGFREKFFGK
jgi:hypothetical protein